MSDLSSVKPRHVYDAVRPNSYNNYLVKMLLCFLFHYL